MQMTCPVVGVTFRPAQVKNIVKSLNIGDEVQLQADPENEYDSTAVAVYYDDTHIGFVPKEQNTELFKRLTDGCVATGEIIMFENSLKPIIEINVA